MWIFTTNSMLSIVQHQNKPAKLLVRARFPGDIEEMFPRARVRETPGHDYRFRATVTRKAVATALANAAMRIDYGNFKQTLDDPDRHTAYFAVWAAMKKAQDAIQLPVDEEPDIMGFDRIDFDEPDKEEP